MSSLSNSIPVWLPALDEMLGEAKESLAWDPEFMDNAFDPGEAAILPSSLSDRLAMLLGEAGRTLLMLEPYLQPGRRILEVGGGAGMIYALLRSRGMLITSLEPGTRGFGDRHRAGLRLLRLLGVDPDGWLRQNIEDFLPEARDYDLVFSYNVLEHLPDLDRSFAAMARVMGAGGIMLHQCPNYAVPYEPHYNIPLLPLRPEWTSFFFPGLKDRDLWKGLNFISVNKVRSLCRRHGLLPDFCRAMAYEAFQRVLTDPGFSARKRGLSRLAVTLHKTGMIKLLRILPPAMATPMQFTASRDKTA